MKITVSKLRRIINEEIGRCLSEQQSQDVQRLAREKATALKKAADAAEQIAQHSAVQDNETVEKLRATADAAEDETRSVAESDEIEEIWPTLARAAGSYAAGKLGDRILGEYEEEDV